MMAERRNEAIWQDFFEAYNRRDVDAIMKLCADDCVAIYPDLTRYSKNEWRSMFGKEFQAFPDAQVRNVSVISQGDRVAIEFDWTATQQQTYAQGELEWSTVGVTFDIPCVFIADMKDGCLKLVKYYWNRRLIEQQSQRAATQGWQAAASP